MFTARGIAVSCSVFLIVYAVLSLAVSVCWRTVWLHSHGHPARRAADLLFALRIFPLVFAAVITLAITVPSFLLLEPRAIDEPMGIIPVILGICCAALGILGAGNAGIALRRASRRLAMWTREAQPVDSFTGVPVLRISQAVPAKFVPAKFVPAMTASGIVRPKILLSGLAESMLTANELQTSLRHELAHVRRRDNLKKLILSCVPFPGMRVLEGTWLEATEMAADDAAVSNAGEALDLASALIKLSRVEAIQHPSDLTAALAHSSGSVMKTRVERLIAWSDDHFASPHRFSSSCGPEYGLGAILAMFAVLTVTYGQLLVRVHTITEWLVR